MWIVLVVAALAGLPVEDVRWDVTVRGPVAEAWVTQRVVNNTTYSQRGHFSLPLPYDGAVDALRVRVGETVIEGDIKERVAAREAYDEAVQQGVIAGLTTQRIGGEFTQEIANIPAGEVAHISLRVRWPVRRIADGYELVIPTRVAPRFGAPHVGDPAGARHPVVLNIDVDAGFDVSDVRSPTHTALELLSLGPSIVGQDLGITSGSDVVVRWSAELDGLQAAALGPDDHTVLIVEGPTAVPATNEPTEWLVVLDTSGSMTGVPWLQARAIVHTLIDGLSAEDSVGMVTFGGSIYAVPAQPGAAGQRAVMGLLDRSGPNGGTDLHRAVQHSLDLKSDPGRRRVMVLITDGLVDHDAATLAALTQDAGRLDVAMVMLGEAPNAALIERMATAAGGYLTRALPSEHGEPGTRVLTAMQQARCTDVRVRWRGTVGETTHVPHTLFAGRPVVVMAAHDRPPLAAEVSCRMGSMRWSATAMRRDALDDGAVRSLFGRARLEAVMQEGWGTGADAQQQGTEIALRYGLVSPWTSLVAIDHSALAAQDGVDVVNTSRGAALTREFLDNIPPGRSYQSAVGMAAGVVGGGGNPNMAGGLSNENTYILDGVNITDPVTGTFSLNFNYRPPTRRQAQWLAPYAVRPSLPAASNNTEVHVELGGGSQHDALGGVFASGALVRDLVWLASRADHGQWSTARQTGVGVRVHAQPTSEWRTWAAAHRHVTDIAQGSGRWDQALAGVLVYPSSALSGDVRAMWDAQHGLHRQRRLVLGQARLRYDHGPLVASADTTVGAVSDGTRDVPAAQAHVRGDWVVDESSVAAQVGVTHIGRTVPTATVRGHLSRLGRTWLTVQAAQEAPPVVTVSAVEAEAPVTRQVLAEVGQEVVEDVQVRVQGGLANAQTWGRSLDVFAADLGSPTLADRGGHVQVELSKVQSRRWSASVVYRHQRRRVDAEDLSVDGIEHMLTWTDRLRRHRVSAQAAWRLPTDPWTHQMGGTLTWMSAVPDASASWADARLHWGLWAEQDLDVRYGKILVRLTVEQGATSALNLTGSDGLRPVPWSRFAPEDLARLRWAVSARWRI